MKNFLRYASIAGLIAIIGLATTACGHHHDSPDDKADQVVNHRYDIIILDVMLPEMDGFETLKVLRSSYSTPVIMLTARGDTTDRIVGLELGADDYLPKPFEPRELVARISSIVKRAKHNSAAEMAPRYRDIAIDFDRCTVLLNDSEVILSKSEFDILSLLARHPSKCIQGTSLSKVYADTTGMRSTEV